MATARDRWYQDVVLADPEVLAALWSGDRKIIRRDDWVAFTDEDSELEVWGGPVGDLPDEYVVLMP